MPFAALLGLLSSLNGSFLQIAAPVTISLSQTFLVILEAIGVNCLYAVGRRKFTNIEKMRRVNAEMKAFRAEMSAAQKAGDKQKLEKLKRKQQQMQKMQAEMSLDNFKPTLLFMLPLLGVYYLVSSFLKNSILAIGPIPFQVFNYGPPIEIPFFWWYFVCSFTFSGIITRLFGLTLD
ncbi:MAG: EMC3/TMCO1 family protein [Nitrososphaerales archaeon]